MVLSALTACGTPSKTESSKTETSVIESETSSDADSQSEKSEESKVEEQVSDNKLGDYEVEILSARKLQDYEGKDCIVVKYKFTNNSEDAQAFLYAIKEEAYQDGVELETAVITDESLNIDDTMKKIKTGVSIEVEQGFVMTSESDIEIEVSELISFDDKAKISKTFTYSELG